MDDITRAIFIRPGGRSLSIWERMSQKNYVDALIVSSNLTMVKTTKLGSTLRDHAHDGRGCTRGDRLAHGAQLRHDAARERNHVGQTG